MPKENRLTLNLVVSNALMALAFYQDVLEGKPGEVFEFPNRPQENEATIFVGHVALRILDANPAYDCFAPKPGETSSIWLQLRVDDVDATLKRADRQGAVDIQAASEFMGLYYAQFTDPFGYTWTINQQLKEISFQDRYEAYMKLQEERVEEEAEEEGNTHKIQRIAKADWRF